MTGLPRTTDNTRPREAFDILVIDSIERLTTALRRGDAFSERALRDMEKIRRRLDAFGMALDSRLALVEEE